MDDNPRTSAVIPFPLALAPADIRHLIYQFAMTSEQGCFTFSDQTTPFTPNIATGLLRVKYVSAVFEQSPNPLTLRIVVLSIMKPEHTFIATTLSISLGAALIFESSYSLVTPRGSERLCPHCILKRLFSIELSSNSGTAIAQR